MLFIVSPYSPTAMFNSDMGTEFFAFKDDAQRFAKKRASETNEPQFIYCLNDGEKIDPPDSKSWEVTFSRIESDTVIVKAKEFHEAIQKAREFFPADEWELIRSTLLTEEKLS